MTMIREAVHSDLHGLLELYLHLHEDRVPEDSAALRETWAQIMRDPNHHIIVDEEGGRRAAAAIHSPFPIPHSPLFAQIPTNRNPPLLP